MFHFVDLNVTNPMFGYITMVFSMDALTGTLTLWERAYQSRQRLFPQGHLESFNFTGWLGVSIQSDLG